MLQSIIRKSVNFQYFQTMAKIVSGEGFTPSPQNEIIPDVKQAEIILQFTYTLRFTLLYFI